MMDKPENIRLAEPEDIEPIFWSLYRTYSEDNDLGVPISPMAVFRKVEAMCNRQGGLAGVIDGPHGIVASIALQAVPFWFGYDEQPFITEIWCYVVKQYRKEGRFLYDLFNFAEWHRQDMSESLGYDMVLENAVLSTNRLPGLMRLYQQFYGAPTGGVFWSRGEGQDDVLRHQQQQQHESGDEPSAERVSEHGPNGDASRLANGSQYRDADRNDSADKRGGSRLLRPARTASEHARQSAPATLHRSTGRTAEPESEHSDLGDSGRAGTSRSLFD